jgi:hypothetical protein
MLQRPWSRLAGLAAVLVFAASPALAVAQAEEVETVSSYRASTLHGCYRFVCLTDRAEVDVVAWGTAEDPLNWYSYWGSGRWTYIDAGGRPYMLDFGDGPPRQFGRTYYNDGPRCCDHYWEVGKDDPIMSFVSMGEDGGVTREEALAVIYAPLGTFATFYVYTPRPGKTPPSGAKDLRPYSIQYRITIGENGLVSATSSVPEPATLALTAGGLLALGCVAWRRRA